jgi:RecA-family ATPase
VIYCHHHSKGAQGGKNAMDRASGSGVFARDPDALLDMIELPVSEALAKAEADRMTRELCVDMLGKSIMGIDPDAALSQDDQCSAVRTLAACERLLAPFEYAALLKRIEAARTRLGKRTAWRIEGTLREFERFAPVNVWFDYPVHVADRAGVLQDVPPEEPKKPWQKGAKKNKENAPSRRAAARERLDMAVASANMGKPPTVHQIADYMDLDESTVRKYLKHSDKFILDRNTGTVIEKDEGQEKT